MIKMYADQGTGTLRKSNHCRTDLVERGKGLMAFCMSNDNGITGFLGSVDCSAQCFHTRHIEGGDCHVILLGNGTDIAKIYQHD